MRRTDPSSALTAAYRQCREISAQHGRTYFLATRLLAPEQRPAVHAMYAFARVVDDIVDESATDEATDKLTVLAELEHELRAGLGGHPPANAVLLALCDTAQRYEVDPELFWSFLRSMRMDIPGTPEHVARYQSMPQLRDYMYGSAAVIGLQILPVLGTVGPIEEAEPGAIAMGEAFQLTNFLRDVGDDLDRGRIYLPQDELSAFGVDADLLQYCAQHHSHDPRISRAIAHFIATTRAAYRRADTGLVTLSRTARPCVEAAMILYAAILDEIERNDFRVLDRRAVVPWSRKLTVAAPRLTRAVLARARQR